MRARPFAAVHVDGQPEHEACRLALGGEREEARGVGGEGLARDRLDAGGDAADRDRSPRPRWSWCRGRARSVRRGRADAAQARQTGRMAAGMGVAYHEPLGSRCQTASIRSLISVISRRAMSCGSASPRHVTQRRHAVMQITWFGHSAFRLDFAGNAVLIDPFFTGNPAFVSDKAAADEGRDSHIVLTHGHGDHVGDTLDIAKANGATGDHELRSRACGSSARGLKKLDPMNTGGTTDQGGFTVTLVRADHSSGDIVERHADLSRQSVRRDHQGDGRADRLSHGRHRHLLRHGADRGNPRSRRSPWCRSATASP